MFGFYSISQLQKYMTIYDPEAHITEDDDVESSKTLSYTDLAGWNDLPLDIWLSFSDSSEEYEYEEFTQITKASSKSIGCSDFLFIYIILWVLISNLFSFTGNDGEIVFIAITTILIVVEVYLSYLVISCQIFPSHETERKNHIRSQLLSHAVSFEWAYSIIACLTPGISQLGKTSVGACTSHGSSVIFEVCNPMDSCGSLPQSLMLMTFIAPVAAKLLLYSSDRLLSVICWLISLLTTIGAISMVPGDSQPLYLILLFFVGSAFVLYEIEFDQRHQFLLWRKNKVMYKQTIEMKFEQNISTNLSEELRNIISNTAHDMKSPCTGVMLGLESLASSLQKTTRENFHANRKPHMEIIHYMNSTIAFMMMSINRSMDFTKIQGKLELTPVYENIELAATLHWAIDCVTWQNETSIKLNAIEELNGFTDKIWLKDNLLCFIANAVKFTSDGTQIMINVLKHTDDDVHTEIEVQVIDSGPALTDADRQKFFLQPAQRFRKQGGLGLGLFVLGHRIKALNGFYGSEARKDGHNGSMFWFRIPFQKSRKKSQFESGLIDDDLIRPDSGPSSAHLVAPLTSTSISFNDQPREVKVSKEKPGKSTVISNVIASKSGSSYSYKHDGSLATSNPANEMNSPFQWLRSSGPKRLPTLQEKESTGNHSPKKRKSGTGYSLKALFSPSKLAPPDAVSCDENPDDRPTPERRPTMSSKKTACLTLHTHSPGPPKEDTYYDDGHDDRKTLGERLEYGLVGNTRDEVDEEEKKTDDDDDRVSEEGGDELGPLTPSDKAGISAKRLAMQSPSLLALSMTDIPLDVLIVDE